MNRWNEFKDGFCSNLDLKHKPQGHNTPYGYSYHELGEALAYLLLAAWLFFLCALVVPFVALAIAKNKVLKIGKEEKQRSAKKWK